MKRNEFRFLISQRVPNFSCADRAHRHVGVAAERAFLHVAVADLEVAHQRVDLLHVRDRFLRRAHVGLGDDLEQRRAGAIEVDARQAVEVLVQRLAGVLFEVRARDADRLARAVVEHDLERALLDDRLLVLADLVALRQIGIEVVLAREHRAVRDRARRPRGRTSPPCAPLRDSAPAARPDSRGRRGSPACSARRRRRSARSRRSCCASRAARGFRDR